MEEIFKLDITLNEKIELASKFAMKQVNKVIKTHIDKLEMSSRLELEAYNRSKIISIKYEDSDLYRLEQKSKAKREIINYINNSSDDLFAIGNFFYYKNKSLQDTPHL
jgi:hypothetical protein